jgi:hypothetical protein
MQRVVKDLTAGQLARAFRVALRTVTRLVDKGDIKGYRVPGGHDRRIPILNALEYARRENIEHAVEALEELAAQHGVPVPFVPRLLILSPDASIAGPFSDTCFDVTHAPSLLYGGLFLGRRAFRAAILDCAFGSAEVSRCVENIRRHISPPTVLCVIVPEDAEQERWQQAGASIVWKQPVNLPTAASELRTLLSRRAGRALTPIPPTPPEAPPRARAKKKRRLKKEVAWWSVNKHGHRLHDNQRRALP